MHGNISTGCDTWHTGMKIATSNTDKKEKGGILYETKNSQRITVHSLHLAAALRVKEPEPGLLQGPQTEK